MASPSSILLLGALANMTSNEEKRPQDELTSEHAEASDTELDPSEDYDELCELCGSLNIECLVQDYKWPGKFYALSMLIESASRCRTCERLFNLRRLREVAQFTDEICNDQVQVSFSLEPTVTGCYGILSIDLKDLSDPARGHQRLYLFETRAVFTNEGDVASTRYGLLALQTMGARTSSARSFRTAKRWLDGCLEGHPVTDQHRASTFRTYFGEPKFEAGNGPVRVIDVFSQECSARNRGGESVRSDEWDSDNLLGGEFLPGRRESSRVVDRVDISDPYLALSYRWGSHPSENYVTTRANILTRELNIVEEELARTFQHAIHIARRLGVRYLWIDAICIIQDSTEDWLNESGKMGSIFANAQLTLVAAAGEDSEAGMFNNQSSFGNKAWDERLANRTLLAGSSVRSTLYFVCERLSRPPTSRPHVSGGPLLSRAWCLQEDLLSARKLYYGVDQLHWVCDHLATSEDGLANLDSWPVFLGGYDPEMKLDPARRAIIAWYCQLIEVAYSKRVATKTTDRLIAVAGLARQTATIVKSRYLAGLWEVSIMKGLLWQTKKYEEKASNLYCAPSWSWASREVETVWRCFDPGHENFVPDCEYLGAHIDLLSSDVYGGVISGTLTLRSNVVAVVLIKEVIHGRHQGFSASCEGVRGWAHLDEKMSLWNIRVLAIPILDDVSVLVTENLGSDTHRRVGIWRVASDIISGGISRGLETWDCPAEYLRWRDQILPATPVTEITIV